MLLGVPCPRATGPILGHERPCCAVIPRGRGFFIGLMDCWRTQTPFAQLRSLKRKDMLGTKTRERIELSVTTAWLSFLAIVLIVLINALG